MTSNMYKNGHRRENGQEKLVVDNAEHRTGPDSIYAPQNPWSVETAIREDPTKRCVVFRKEYNMWIEQHHQQKKITGMTTKSKR